MQQTHDRDTLSFCETPDRSRGLKKSPAVKKWVEIQWKYQFWVHCPRDKSGPSDSSSVPRVMQRVATFDFRLFRMAPPLAALKRQQLFVHGARGGLFSSRRPRSINTDHILRQRCDSAADETSKSLTAAGKSGERSAVKPESYQRRHMCSRGVCQVHRRSAAVFPSN